MSKKGFAIAIDGPVAAGKGTIAQKLAQDLHGFYLYTGAMYRCVALACIRRGLDINKSIDVESVLDSVEIVLEGNRVLLNGEDVTERIAESDTANGASVVSTFPKIREKLVFKQQLLAQKAIELGKIVVAEGRDTGIKVFPDAKLKIYLTASDDVRAGRRLVQYQDQGKQESFDNVLGEIRKRDERDKSREIDPLPKNPEHLGYFILDNSLLGETETLDVIKDELGKREIIQ